MKKIILLFFSVLLFLGLFLSFKPVRAAELCVDPDATGLVPCGVKSTGSYTCKYANGGGITTSSRRNVTFGANMTPSQNACITLCTGPGVSQSIFSNGVCSCRFSSTTPYTYNTENITANSLAEATTTCSGRGLAAPAPRPTITQSNEAPVCPCQLGHLFVMARKIFDFIVWKLSAPIAGLLIVIGGICIALSGISPKLYDTGKTMIFGAAIALILIFCSWLIISLIFGALGYSGTWDSFTF